MLQIPPCIHLTTIVSPGDQLQKQLHPLFLLLILIVSLLLLLLLILIVSLLPLLLHRFLQPPAFFLPKAPL